MPDRSLNVLLTSLGCDKNTADSEKMLGLLSSKGFNLTDSYDEADIAIVNTCCFIKSATEESIDKIFELAELKKDRLKFIICAGCMAERYKNEIAADIPEVDAFVGTASIHRIDEVIDRLMAGEKDVKAFDDINSDLGENFLKDRVITEHPYMEYLKIAEGCDKRCTYCAIPYFKGKFRSVPMESLLAESRILAANGVKELILVAQETTSYGIDLYGEKKLHELVSRISEIDGIEWIRLLYCYPEEIYDELIVEMASNPKVLHYIDMPLQHTEDHILKKMGRRINREGIYTVVKKLRSAMPDIVIRTTMITGFPGETLEDHEALLDTLHELKFDRLGVFTYSAEEGTPAAEFPDQIDEDTKEEYRNDIMELQQELSFESNEKLQDTILDVIIEGYLADEDIYVARSYRDAPEVDGFIFVNSPTELYSGSIVRVHITGYDEYDLTGDLCEE